MDMSIFIAVAISKFQTNEVCTNTQTVTRKKYSCHINVNLCTASFLFSTLLEVFSRIKLTAVCNCDMGMHELLKNITKTQEKTQTFTYTPKNQQFVTFQK